MFPGAKETAVNLHLAILLQNVIDFEVVRQSWSFIQFFVKPFGLPDMPN